MHLCVEHYHFQKDIYVILWVKYPSIQEYHSTTSKWRKKANRIKKRTESPTQTSSIGQSYIFQFPSVFFFLPLNFYNIQWYRGDIDRRFKDSDALQTKYQMNVHLLHSRITLRIASQFLCLRPLDHSSPSISNRKRRRLTIRLHYICRELQGDLNSDTHFRSTPEMEKKMKKKNRI